MKLLDLEPEFLRYEERTEGGRVHKYHVTVDGIERAQGVMFLCPKCFKANGGSRGTHAIVCWSRSRGVPDHVTPGPGRWSLHGTGLQDLTLNGDQPGGGGARSVQLHGGCAWHGFITNGEAHE